MFDKRNLKVLAIITMVLITASMFMGCTEESSDALVTVEGEEMILEDLEEMETLSGTVKYQNRMGNWNEEADYEGVALNELVPDMDSNDILKVTASDGYSQKYSYEQVDPTGEKKNIQGDLILAYSENGDKVPDWENGPMIAVLPDDGEFSNADLNVTRSLTSDFNRQTSAGSLWVKNVEKIEIEKDVHTETETALTLEGTTTHDYSLEEIQDMNSYTGEGMFLNSVGNIEGPYEYKGVNVTSLVSNVYSEDDYTLEVEATDGYVMTYTSEQVNGGFKTYDDEGNPTSGEDVTALLAYDEVGEDSLSGGPLRVVMVGEDGPITDGHFWAKMVRYIRVEPAQEDWTLELKGLGSLTMDEQSFEKAVSSDNNKTIIQDGEDTYSGLPLWILVGAVDDEEGDWTLNEDLVSQGYEVKVIAEDGYSYSFDISQVAHNDTIIVASKLNGEPLPADEAPLRITGEGLSGKSRVSQIAEIRLVGL